MAVTHSEVRPGAYYDSVVLMQLQRGLAELPRVLDAGVVMATPANRDLLVAGDLLVDTDAGSDDLLIVVKAEDEDAAASALASVDDLLSRRKSLSVGAFRPRSLEAAVKQSPQAKWVLISVPGRYAADVARDALRLERHVFLYSDNVSIDDEIELKQTGKGKGLLVMGPDCGTAIIGGVGLGFANRVRRGSIGLVGASGTGLQAITSRIHALGGGVSHAIGTGSRDLHQNVGAITARQALDMLDRDPASNVIVLVSKPPERGVASQLLSTARTMTKPAVIHFIGFPPPARTLDNLHFASSLGDAAALAVTLAANHDDVAKDRAGMSRPAGGYLRGLFAGGTLAYEALLGFQTLLNPIFSNAPLHDSQRLSDPLTSQAHTILDLGADEFTQGRLHPMMDNDLRLRRLRQESADPEVASILMDVVLGEGAHPDPTAELAPAISEAKAIAQRDGRALDVTVIVVGTDQDPQQLELQTERLIAAGATVFQDTVAAVAHVTGLLAPLPDGIAAAVDSEILSPPISAVNVGLEIFYESLQEQGASAVHVDWRPPAGGNEKLIALLAKMKST
jgi:FdrA protein